MAEALTKCPKCGKKLLADYGGKVKLRSGMVVFTQSGCQATCPKCGHETPVPVSLTGFQFKPVERVSHVVVRRRPKKA